jgi:hypothetical protein
MEDAHTPFLQDIATDAHFTGNPGRFLEILAASCSPVDSVKIAGIAFFLSLFESSLNPR